MTNRALRYDFYFALMSKQKHMGTSEICLFESTLKAAQKYILLSTSCAEIRYCTCAIGLLNARVLWLSARLYLVHVGLDVLIIVQILYCAHLEYYQSRCKLINFVK